MATTVTEAPVAYQLSQYTWASLANGETGDSVEVLGRPSDICFTATGNSSDGVTIQGSDDGTTWTTESDINGTAVTGSGTPLAGASGGRVYMRSAPRYFRPVVAAGSAFTGSIILTVRGE